jgi:hypothetical protein
MPKARVRAGFDHLPPPPSAPTWCADEAVQIASHLKIKHRARNWQIEYLLGMLNESYIVKLPRLKRDRSTLFDRSPQQLRWLWLSWASKLLGWKLPRPEGHPHGFSAAIHSALRDKVFPYPKVERDDQTTESGSATTAAFGNHAGALTSARSAAARNTTCTAEGAPGNAFANQATVATAGVDTTQRTEHDPSSSGVSLRQHYKPGYVRSMLAGAGDTNSGCNRIIKSGRSPTVATGTYQRQIVGAGSTDTDRAAAPTGEKSFPLDLAFHHDNTGPRCGTIISGFAVNTAAPISRVSVPLRRGVHFPHMVLSGSESELPPTGAIYSTVDFLSSWPLEAVPATTATTNISSHFSTDTRAAGEHSGHHRGSDSTYLGAGEQAATEQRHPSSGGSALWDTSGGASTGLIIDSASNDRDGYDAHRV